MKGLGYIGYLCCSDVPISLAPPGTDLLSSRYTYLLLRPRNPETFLPRGRRWDGGTTKVPHDTQHTHRPMSHKSFSRQRSLLEVRL